MIAGTITWIAGRLPQLNVLNGARGQAGPVEVLADLRLDDPEGLADALGLGADTPPADLVAAAWLRWGREAMSRLHGDFALAIVDRRDGTVVLVRDHVGIHPLHWYRQGPRLLFGGDLAALVDRCGPDLRLDERFLAAHMLRPLAVMPAMRDRTFWQGLAKVAPAHGVTFRAGAAPAPWRWLAWEEAPDVRFRRFDDYAAALRERLEIAVARAVAGPAPVAGHLSGGIDCSSIACLADAVLRRQGRRLAATYTWFAPPGPDRPAGDDAWGLAREVADALDVPLVSCPATAEDQYITARADFTRRPQQMLGYENIVMRHAAAAGVGVILSGWGGDEVVSTRSPAAWFDLLYRGRWAAAIRLRRAGVRPRPRLLRDLAAWACYGMLEIEGRPPATLDGHILDLPFIDRKMAEDVLQDPAFLPVASPRPELGLRRQQIGRLEAGHLVRRLESWAMAAQDRGLTHRYPMLDRTLLTFSLGLPSELVIHDGAYRALLRRALRGSVSERVLNHDKAYEPDRVARIAVANAAAAVRLAAEALQTGQYPRFHWIARKELTARLYPDSLGGWEGLACRQAAVFALLFPDGSR